MNTTTARTTRFRAAHAVALAAVLTLASACAVPARPAATSATSVAPEATSAPTPTVSLDDAQPSPTTQADMASPLPTPAEPAITQTERTPVLPGATVTASNAVSVSLSSQFIDTNMNFTFGLLKQMAQGKAENVFLSGANVSLALAMTANGAKGETFDGMRDALAEPGASLDQMNTDYATLQTLLRRNTEGASVSLANALWAKTGVPFNADFLDRTRNVYGAQVTELNFDDPTAPQTINDWVKQSTNGKIDGIVDNLDPALVLLLTSAIHFKGTWAEKFDPASTVDMPFTLTDGTQKQVPMMFRTGKMSFLQTDQGPAVQLPYAGDTLRMTILLPQADTTADAVLNTLTAAQWRAWQGAFALKDGTLYFPRFKAESDLTLNDALKTLGMSAAFDDQRADFSGMRPVPPQLVITDVRHKSFVEVNEEGTEAAAATSVGVGVTSARPIEDRFEMIVDHPFIITIEDTASGALLFAGVIREP